FPPQRVTADLVRVAEHVQVGKPHSAAICLSGSAALSAATKWIADLDFCEYVQASVETAGKTGQCDCRAGLRKCVAATGSPVACMGVSVGSEPGKNAHYQARRPWAGRVPAEDSALEAAAEHLEWGQVRFAAVAGEIGPLEVTNLVLAIDPRATDTG